jgi:hypothetical protein
MKLRLGRTVGQLLRNRVTCGCCPIFAVHVVPRGDPREIAPRRDRRTSMRGQFTQDPERGAAAINRFWAGVGQE